MWRNAKTHRLRPLANYWVGWAGKTALRLHHVWAGRDAPADDNLDHDLDPPADAEADAAWDFLDAQGEQDGEDDVDQQAAAPADEADVDIVDPPNVFA